MANNRAPRSNGGVKSGRERFRKICRGFLSLTRQDLVTSAILACLLFFIRLTPAQAQGGTGACPTGQVQCPGKGCVALNNDPKNCGRCGNRCAKGQSCVAGVCEGTSTTGTGACPTGQVQCPGKGCVALTNDPKNCGRCGNRCAKGQSCVAGVCEGTSTTGTGACPTGQVQCPGKGCVALNNDPKNCGRCGNRCAKGQSCVAGVCEGTTTTGGGM